MALSRNQIGRDRRICRLDGRWYKRQLARWRRRQWAQDPEREPVKYQGYAA